MKSQGYLQSREMNGLTDKFILRYLYEEKSEHFHTGYIMHYCFIGAKQKWVLDLVR